MAITFFLLSPFALFARDIASCGYLDQANTLYVLQNDVYSEGSCFFIVSPNITLDLNGHKIIYDNAPPIGSFGGDFENSGDWDLSYAPSASIESGTYINPVTVFSGSKSLRFAIPNSDQYVVSSRRIFLKADTAYSLSAMVYNQTDSNATAYVEIRGTSLQASYTGKTWRGFQYIRAEFRTNSTPGAVVISAGIRGAESSNSGYLYIDDIRIQRTRVGGIIIGPPDWQGTKLISDAARFGNANSATVLNGSVKQGQGKSDFSPAILVTENSGTGWIVHDMTLTADGVNSRAFFSYNAINSKLYNNHIYNPQRAIVSRDQFDGAAVKIENGGYGTKIYNNTIHQGIQGGIRLLQKAGGPQNEIYGNTISLQTKYTNDFAIVTNGSSVYENVIDCSGENDSCRGILASEGSASAKIYNNTIRVQELKRNQEYDGCETGGAYGIQLEAGSNAAVVYGNNVTAISANCESSALRLNAESGKGNTIFNNKFTALTNGAARATSIKLDGTVANTANIHHNTFVTNHRWIYVSGSSVIEPRFFYNKWETGGTIPSTFHPFEINKWNSIYFIGTFVGNSYGPGDRERFELEYFRTTSGSRDPHSSFKTTAPINSPTNLQALP